MDGKKILVIIALVILILGTTVLAMRSKKNPTSKEQQSTELTKEQKAFADDFSKAMQDAKGETKK